MRLIQISFESDDRMFKRRLPLEVRLNRSFFPADLITVRPRAGHTVEGLSIAQATTGDMLKAHSGGGPGQMILRQRDSLDFFVRDERTLSLSDLPSGNLRSVIVKPGEALFLRIQWQKVNGQSASDEIGVVWPYSERAGGRAPFIYHGEDARQWADYILDNSKPVSGSLLRRPRRVRLLRRRDISRRIRTEFETGQKVVDTNIQVRVASISIRGFRGFREEGVLKLAQPTGAAGTGLTFVVGANNTGKSTIWESFDAVARKLKADVSFSEGRRNKGTPGGIRIQLARADGTEYVLESRNADTSETKAEWSPSAAAQAPFEIVSVPSRRQFQASFSRGFSSERDWMSNSSEFTRIRQDDQFTGRLFELHNSEEKKKKFDDLMSRVIGHPFEWNIELADGQHGQSYYLKVRNGEGESHTSEGLGDGIISLLFILNALYDSQPHTLLVFDEPELSLHPQLVRRLGEVLAEYGSDRQIVVFTHSPQLISWSSIQAGAEIARVFKDDEGSKIAQASRKAIDAIPKSRGGWKNPHTFGLDATEALFLDDGLIIVEGQEDAALLPRAFELAGVEPVNSIFGWGSGGADNIIKIVGLLEELGFTRIAAVLDNNVSKTVDAIRDRYEKVLVVEIPAADIRDKPAYSSGEVAGLLTKDGKKIKSELKMDAQSVLTTVSEFIRTGEMPSPVE